MSDPNALALLLAQCAQRRPDALAALYEATSTHLFALAVRMLKRRNLAEEALQDSFISIWNNAARFDMTKSQPMTWMTRIVRNRCIDLLRRPDLEIADPDGLIESLWADDAPGPLARLQSSQEGRRLAECMKGLNTKQRLAIVLSFFDDLSHGEIAQRLQAPLGSVKSWVRRGLEQLKGCLG